MSIAKNTFYYLLAGTLPYVLSFFTLPIYTRYLTTEDYGILSLLLAFTGIIKPIISLQLFAVLSKDFFLHRSNDKELSSIFSTNFWATILLVFVFSFFILLTFLFFPQVLWAGNKISPKAFCLAISSMMFMVVADVPLTFLQSAGRGKTILISSVTNTLVTILLTLILLVTFKMKVEGVLFAQLLGSVALLTSYLVFCRSYICFVFSLLSFKRACHFGIPLIPHALGGYLFMYSDRLILEKYVSLGAIGLYSLSDKLASTLKFLINSANNALIPHFMDKATKDFPKAVEEFQRITIRWGIGISLIYVALSLFSYDLLLLLTTPDFLGAFIFIPLLAGSYIFRGLYCFSSYPLFFYEKTKYIPIITVSSGVSNIALNLLLDPYWGVWGAVCATFFSFLMTFIISEVICYKRFSMNLNLKKLTLIVLPALIVSNLFAFFSLKLDYAYSLLFRVFGFSLFAFFLFRCFREDFVWGMGFLKKYTKETSKKYCLNHRGKNAWICISRLWSN